MRIGRDVVVRHLNLRKRDPGRRVPAHDVALPDRDPENLLGIVSADLKVPFDTRELLRHVVDGSVYDEFKPAYGKSLSTGWAEIHGYPVGILASIQGVLFSEEAQKAAQFIQLANQKDVPLVFVHNTTGFMVGKE